MKKFIILLPTLLLITITGCRTTKVEKEIILPPKPQREEMEAPRTIEECAEVINYYNSLVKLWENWGERVEAILTEEKK
jgi:hypothetical protein